MRKFILLGIISIIALVYTNQANAVVRVVDVTQTEIDEFPAFTSAEVDTVDNGFASEPEDYSLLFCATEDSFPGSNSFNAPAPDGWTELDNTRCAEDGCISGIWGKFTGTEDNVPTTCSWVDPQNVFVGGSFRYADVDDDPIIAIACQSGSGVPVATAPSIITEPGSHVVRAVTFSVSGGGINCLMEVEAQGVGTSRDLNLCANAEIANILLNAITETDFEGGPTGEYEVELPGVETDWRACTIGIRMFSPGPRPIPTMSEWGFMAVAVFMGIAGIWFLRRRTASA